MEAVEDVPFMSDDTLMESQQQMEEELIEEAGSSGSGSIMSGISGVSSAGGEYGSASSTTEPEMEAGEIEGSDQVTFSPPVYLQRYCRVHDVLDKLLGSEKYKKMHESTGKTVMEVGCAEFGMMRYFKGFLDIGKILFVDLDQQLLEDKAYLLKPLPAEYLQRLSRPQPLVVEAYGGDITKIDSGLLKTNPSIWAVVGIELIEHLYPDVLRGFEETVFGIVSPTVVIVTTPNADFNEVFNLPVGKFRHWDHKFEWSRREFQDWCDKIVGEFTEYSYTIEGICEGPEETRHLGCVSQMAIFEKKENALGTSSANMMNRFSHRIQNGAFKLIQSLEYPNHRETRTSEQIALNEFSYYVSNFLFSRSMIDHYQESGTTELKVPITQIQALPGIPNVVSADILSLKNVIEKAGYQVVNEAEGMSVVFDVESYVTANYYDDSDSNDDEQELCVDLEELNVNRVPQSLPMEDECWET